MGDTEEKIREFLNSKKEVIFAYLYGSYLKKKDFHDIDIGLYLKVRVSLKFIANLKIEIASALGVPADIIDLRVFNHILDNPDSFCLLYLKKVLEEGKLLVNKNPKVLSDFLEDFSSRYREVEFLLSQVNEY